MSRNAGSQQMTELPRVPSSDLVVAGKLQSQLANFSPTVGERLAEGRPKNLRKIALIDEGIADPDAGHPIRHAAAIRQLLALNNIEAVTVNPRPLESRPSSRLRGIVLGMPVFRQVRGIMRLAHLVHCAVTHGVDALWFLTADGVILRMALLFIAGRITRTALPRIIFTFHTTQWLTPRSRLRQIVTPVVARWLLRSPNVYAIVVYTHALRDALQHVGVKRNKIHLLPHPVSVMGEQDKARARARLGIPEDEVVVGFLGFIRRGKGFPTLIKALRVMRRRPFCLVIAGKPLPGGLGEGATEEAVQAEVEQLMGGRAVVSFRRLSNEAYEQYMQACHIIVLPYEASYYSRYASTSGVLFEAISAGCQVVVTDVSDFRSVVAEHELGIVVKPGSPRDLARGILQAVRRVRRGWTGGSETVLRCVQAQWSRFLDGLKTLGWGSRGKKGSP